MKIIDRLLINHLELGLHPKLGACFLEVVLFSLGVKFKVNFSAIKKALQNKWIGFFFDYQPGAAIIRLLGVELVFWIYRD